MIYSICKKLLPLVLLLFFSKSTWALETEHFSLADAWQRLLTISDKLAAEDAGVERAQLHVEAAKSMYMPEVTVSAQYLHLDDDMDLAPQMLFDNMAGGETLSHILGTLAGSMGIPMELLQSGATTHLVDQSNLLGSVTAVWPIYTGGRITAAQHIAKEQYRESSYHRDMVKREQFEELVSRYFGVVFAQQVVKTRKSVEKGLQHHLRNAKLLEKQGQISKVERLQAAASADKARVERKKAERQLEISRTALAKMLKADSRVIPVDSLFINTTLPEMEAFIEKTHADYPGIKILEAKKNQAGGMVDVEKGTHLPAVALLGNYMMYENNSLSTELAPSWFLGVGVTYTLFDREGRAEKLESAKTAVQQVGLHIAQVKKDLSILTEKHYREAMQFIEEYQGLRSSLELAQESVTLRNKSFSQGFSTSLDVVDAEMFLAGVKIQRSLAVYNYIKSLSKLLVLSGDTGQFTEYQATAAAIQQP